MTKDQLKEIATSLLKRASLSPPCTNRTVDLLEIGMLLAAANTDPGTGVHQVVGLLPSWPHPRDPDPPTLLRTQ